MNGLEKLWTDYISQRDYQIGKDSHYKQVQTEADPFLNKVWDELSKEGKRAFDDYCYKLGELYNISEKHYFIIGFRMGAHIMFDLMGEYKGDLIPMDGGTE